MQVFIYFLKELTDSQHQQKCRFSHQQFANENQINKWIEENEDYIKAEHAKMGKTNIDQYYFNYLKRKQQQNPSITSTPSTVDSFSNQLQQGQTGPQLLIKSFNYHTNLQNPPSIKSHVQQQQYTQQGPYQNFNQGAPMHQMPSGYNQPNPNFTMRNPPPNQSYNQPNISQQNPNFNQQPQQHGLNLRQPPIQQPQGNPPQIQNQGQPQPQMQTVLPPQNQLQPTNVPFNQSNPNIYYVGGQDKKAGQGNIPTATGHFQTNQPNFQTGGKPYQPISTLPTSHGNFQNNPSFQQNPPVFQQTVTGGNPMQQHTTGQQPPNFMGANAGPFIVGGGQKPQPPTGTNVPLGDRNVPNQPYNPAIISTAAPSIQDLLKTTPYAGQPTPNNPEKPIQSLNLPLGNVIADMGPNSTPQRQPQIPGQIIGIGSGGKSQSAEKNRELSGSKPSSFSEREKSNKGESSATKEEKMSGSDSAKDKVKIIKNLDPRLAMNLSFEEVGKTSADKMKKAPKDSPATVEPKIEPKKIPEKPPSLANKLREDKELEKMQEKKPLKTSADKDSLTGSTISADTTKINRIPKVHDKPGPPTEKPIVDPRKRIQALDKKTPISSSAIKNTGVEENKTQQPPPQEGNRPPPSEISQGKVRIEKIPTKPQPGAGDQERKDHPPLKIERPEKPRSERMEEEKPYRSSHEGSGHKDDDRRKILDKMARKNKSSESEGYGKPAPAATEYCKRTRNYPRETLVRSNIRKKLKFDPYMNLEPTRHFFESKREETDKMLSDIYSEVREYASGITMKFDSALDLLEQFKPLF